MEALIYSVIYSPTPLLNQPGLLTRTKCLKSARKIVCATYKNTVSVNTNMETLLIKYSTFRSIFKVSKYRKNGETKVVFKWYISFLQYWIQLLSSGKREGLELTAKHNEHMRLINKVRSTPGKTTANSHFPNFIP